MNALVLPEGGSIKLSTTARRAMMRCRFKEDININVICAHELLDTSKRGF